MTPVRMLPFLPLLALFAAAPVAGRAQAPSSVSAGQGSYAAAPPTGAKAPPAERFATDAVRGPLPTSDWWSSLLWTRYSDRMYPHPLAVQAGALGLRVFYPGTRISANTKAIVAGMPGGADDLTVGLTGISEFPDARLHGWSDWFVTMRFGDAANGLDVSCGHGSPYVYATFRGGEPRIVFGRVPKVWAGTPGKDAVLGVSIDGRHYGLFAPTGSAWTVADRAFECDTRGKRFLSVAVLPDDRPETLARFARYAHAHVVDSRITWEYDERTATVTTRFTVKTQPREGTEAGTLFALYPHQWTRTDAETPGAGYGSVRGPMRLVAGSGFSTRAVFPGVLPALPPVDDAKRPEIRRLLEADLREPLAPAKDTYWEGKQLGRLATAIPIAEQAGMDTRPLVDALKRRLEAWFTAAGPDGAKQKTLFAYDRGWGTLIGYPASYGSDTDLSDHHFHYGYFLRAAAEVARHDPAWAEDARWGGMVRLLIRDIASPDRDDPLFPFLRCFDPYAGHSWASGAAKFADGNNQESSSEAMNAWYGLILWGDATGDRRLRDLGIYLYTTELAAIESYWFDVEDRWHPAEFTRAAAAMLWGGKTVHETWFSANPEMVYGINWLPVHGGSLYLGRYPDYVRRSYASLVQDNGGANWDAWADTVLMFLALADPEEALRQADALGDRLPFQDGNTRANFRHWLLNLRRLGQVDRTVSADHPLTAVFRREKEISYVVYNRTPAGRTVTFSDGTRVETGTAGWTVHRVTRP